MDSIAELVKTKLAELQLGAYSGTRSTYWAAVYDAVQEYLAGDRRITAFKSDMKQAMVNAFPAAAADAWEDGGAKPPLSEDANALVTSWMNSELANIDALFVGLKTARDSEEKPDPITEAYARADGYANGLDSLYSMIKVMAAGSQMLTFDGEDGKDTCAECQKYKGQRHKASWWIAKGLVPYRGNDNYTCGNWKCKHYLRDDNDVLFTI